MKFHLYYRGPVKSNAGAAEKMKLRQVFHPQLRELWAQLPVSSLADEGAIERPEDSVNSILQDVGPFTFAPLVTGRYKLVAEVNVLMLRPQPPGEILRHSGDLDNRLKTLLDSLSMPPRTQDLPRGATPTADETPFFCLLEDDALVVAVSVRSDRLLVPASDSEVVALIEVVVRPTVATWGNLSLAGD